MIKMQKNVNSFADDSCRGFCPALDFHFIDLESIIDTYKRSAYSLMSQEKYTVCARNNTEVKPRRLTI